MNTRPFPPEDYCYPDARNVRIAELELSLVQERAEKEVLKAALLESNNTAARYAALYKILSDALIANAGVEA